MRWTGRIVQHNGRALQAHRTEWEHLCERLARDGIDPDSIGQALTHFSVAIPSWALTAGGTRFGRFPGPGEPRSVFEKLEDAAVVARLTGASSYVSLHLPWDQPKDPAALRAHAKDLCLRFASVNSNTFQDQPYQAHSYKFGSLCHTDSAVRQQAIEHNLRVIDIGQALGSESITVWLADGSNYPGQMDLRESFERTLGGLSEIYASLPDRWRLFTEHKPYEPAFYATVVQDWGSSLMLAQALGERAYCLVDLGHHAPNTNVELIVARLVTAGKLGGFHFNDSAYGDDDLTTGSIRPFQLFLVFNELVAARTSQKLDVEPEYVIDQSHNVKDPIEALIMSVDNLQQAYAKALLVRRDELAFQQQANDVVMAEKTLRAAYDTDVRPLVAEVRLRRGTAMDPLGVFREGNYRAAVAAERSQTAYVPPQSL